MADVRTIELRGCTPEPLMNYLKALGVLRVVAEQVDGKAVAAWRGAAFVLRSSAGFDELVEFFLEHYQPTPIAAPWAGGSGFFGKDNRIAINVISASDVERLYPYREAIKKIHSILAAERIVEKPANEVKERLLRRYHREMPDAFVNWMDAAVVLQGEGQVFPPILGTGGNDGRLDFTQNFMQRLVELRLHVQQPHEHSWNWLLAALRGDATADLTKAAVGQFAPGRAGGPNGTQGMEAAPLDNPWDFVLMLEGTLMLAGSVARRMSAAVRDRAAFPFTVSSLPVGFGSGSENESAESRGEIWLPLWRRFTSAGELRAVFGEGRAELGSRPARDSVDFARAISNLGTDRGIESFARTGFLKRSGKAFLATPLGRIAVRTQPSTHLLREVDPWLDRYRRACAGDIVPARFVSALRRIDSAIFDYCRYGTEPLFANILAAFGSAERQLATGERFRQNERRTIHPISGLSPGWLAAAQDDTREFAIAAALTSIRGIEGTIAPLRANLEPVQVGRTRVVWDDASRCVVWNSSSLARNLSAVLQRRLLDAGKQGDERRALNSLSVASLTHVSAFINGDVKDERVEELLWGLMLAVRSTALIHASRDDATETLLPRVYALLKLALMPESISIERRPNDECCAR
ncbi:MAG TPA: type I-U CRISPR-associated protein Csx17 [Pirellulales bacterium]|nr:type I-U CRISPR-associated protein Csx17 [Pirellulales bacterium]